MKKIVPFFFMVLFIAPFYGTYLYLSLQQKTIQEAVQLKLEEGIPSNELVKLTFFKKEIPKLLKWEHDKEFEFKGQMYDVVEVTDVGDSLQYLCWWDKAETATKKNKQKLLHARIDTSNSEKHISFTFSDYYKSIYFIFNPFNGGETPENGHNKPITSSTFTDILLVQSLSPPPRLRN
ncbi:MAG: hypothetical protein NWQ39_03025 [Saprospiraceae bacterium]|nr:hypothetical protein [Saprospiraceae bacterium]MDP5091504.1 hypothetical protein [Saprospiraceae bacterium]